MYGFIGRAGVLLCALSFCTGISGAQRSAVDAVVRQAMRDYGVPAMSIAVVERGRVTYARGYGSIDGGAIPADAGTHYQIGSVTKMFTAALIVRLVGERRLRLNESVRSILPEYANAGTVRVRDLLDQRSGIPDYNTLPMLVRELPAMAPGHADQHAILSSIESQPLRFTPGSRFEYSNSNYFVLGMIAQRLTGRSYAELLRGFFLAPLRLSGTTFGGTPQADWANAFTKTPLGVLAVPPWDAQVTFAAGGLRSNVLDLARWDIALMDGVAVSPSELREMAGAGDGAYGFGMFAYAMRDQLVIWHDGTVLGFRSMNVMLPRERGAVIVLANADFAHAPVTATRIEQIAFGLPADSTEPPDWNLPRYAYPLALACGAFPLLVAFGLRHGYRLALAGAGIAYAAGTVALAVGIALSCAAVILLAVAALARRLHRVD